MSDAMQEHMDTRHVGHLPAGFEPDVGVTWSQVHMLTHRLFKWKGWEHTALCECGEPLRPQSTCAQCGGTDPWGAPMFCPICDFCCGC